MHLRPEKDFGRTLTEGDRANSASVDRASDILHREVGRLEWLRQCLPQLCVGETTGLDGGYAVLLSDSDSLAKTAVLRRCLMSCSGD
jgi:hypothetical protein